MAGGQQIDSGQGSVTPSGSVPVTGSAVTSSHGTVARAQDVTGSAVTGDVGTPGSARLVRLQSRKVGGGSAIQPLLGSASPISLGAMPVGLARPALGQAITAALGTFGKSRSKVLSGQAATAAAGTMVVSGGGASLAATRTIGPAPLAVLIDASALGAFDGTYTFNFGDPGAGNWSITGLPKNTQTGGALAAHVYDNPGTYTITVGSSSIVITVQDPNVVFSGANTIYVSPSGSQADVPGGYTAVTTLPSSYAGKRVLLHRGESFGVGIDPLRTDSGFQVGAYPATGAKPIVTGVTTTHNNTTTAWTSDWTVMDLNVGAAAVNITATTTRFLLYRCDVKTTPTTSFAMVNLCADPTRFFYSQSSAGTQALMKNPNEMFVVDCDLQGVVNGIARPQMVIQTILYKSAIMGNFMDFENEHTLRIFGASTSFIAHNRMGGNAFDSLRGASKIHSMGTQAFGLMMSSSLSPLSEKLIEANNYIGSTTYPGTELSGFNPQNADDGSAVQGLQDCIAENNIFIYGPSTQTAMNFFGRRMHARGNTRQGGGSLVIKRVVEGWFDNPASGYAAWDGPYLGQITGGVSPDRYVRQGATGANNGTDWNNAWTSFSSVTNANVDPGFTVWAAGGTYNSVSLSVDGTAGSRVTIKKATVASHGTATGWSDSYDAQVIFDGQGGSRGLNLDGSSYLTLDGQVRSSLQSGYGMVARNGYYAVHADDGTGSNGITLRYMELTVLPISDTSAKEDGLQGKGNDLLVEFCYLHDNDSQVTHGDSIQWFGGANITLRYNVFKNGGQMFKLGEEAFNTWCTAVNIYYNLFYNRGGDHYNGMVFAVGTPQPGDTVNIYNNTFDLETNNNDGFNSFLYPITSGGGTINCKNNAMRNTNANNITATIHTNNGYDNSGTGLVFNIPSETNRVVAADLGFVDGAHATAPNYHLTSGSPLRGAGVNVGLSIDMDGVTVPSTPDIGCFQFV